MAHKKKHGARVPPGNQPQGGPPGRIDTAEQDKADTKGGASFQEQDPKRRLGDYESEAEHSIQQPGGKNDTNH